MTEPIVRHGGIFCEDLQVKTRHSWIHHLHSTRNICWLCWWWLKQLATLSVQSVSEWMMFSLESLESLDSLHLICWFSVATYTTYTDCGPSELMLAGWFVTGWNQCNGHSQPRVPRHIVLNWPRPAYICQYHHQWSGLLGPPLIFSPLFSYPRSCHIEAFNKYQEVRLFPENYPSTHWPYQYKIPPLLAKRSVVLAVIQTGASSIFEMSLNEGPTSAEILITIMKS